MGNTRRINHRLETPKRSWLCQGPHLCRTSPRKMRKPQRAGIFGKSSGGRVENESFAEDVAPDGKLGNLFWFEFYKDDASARGDGALREKAAEGRRSPRRFAFTDAHSHSRQRPGLRRPSAAFLFNYQSAVGSNSSATEIRSVSNR